MGARVREAGLSQQVFDFAGGAAGGVRGRPGAARLGHDGDAPAGRQSPAELGEPLGRRGPEREGVDGQDGVEGSAESGRHPIDRGLHQGDPPRPDGGGRLVPTDRRAKAEWRIPSGQEGEAEPGEIVLAEPLGHGGFGLKPARVVERLGRMGDARSVSIAAASIIAKVTRDRMMVALHDDHPGYNWRSNKGYGTPEHYAGLKAHGVTQHHRHSFAPIRAILTGQSISDEDMRRSLTAAE